VPEPLQIPDALIAALRAAQHVCVLTGAGVSAESGVPTFRDAQSGLWAKFDPMDLATPEAFARDPVLIWKWYRWRRELVSKAEPNPAHIALAAAVALLPKLTLITQNVDGLHQRAGNHDVLEYHGNLFENRCSSESCSIENRVIADDDHILVPKCPECGAQLRPGVVWFGESIPETALSASFAAATDCDLFLSVGTSSLVYPAAGLAEIARDTGSISVEVNPNPTPLSHKFDFVLQGNAGLILPKLVESLPT
jgi:NAD-dependent deacetylase